MSFGLGSQEFLTASEMSLSTRLPFYILRLWEAAFLAPMVIKSGYQWTLILWYQIFSHDLILYINKTSIHPITVENFFSLIDTQIIYI